MGTWMGRGAGGEGEERQREAQDTHLWKEPPVFRACTKEDPVVAREPRLGQAEVEGFHPHQPGDVCLRRGTAVHQAGPGTPPGFV